MIQPTTLVAGLVGATLATTLCACGSQLESSIVRANPLQSPNTWPRVLPTGTIGLHQAGHRPDSGPPFVSAPLAGLRVADEFAVAWLTYDSRHERRSDVLTRVRRFVDRALLNRLRKSPRFHVSWSLLVARKERVTFTVIGTSTTTPRDTRLGRSELTVVVAGILDTVSTLGRTSTPDSLDLLLAPTSHGWRIAAVRGGGS